MDRPGGAVPIKEIDPVITTTTPIDALHNVFLSILPRILRRGEFVFRRVRCPHRRADYLAEMTALCWSWLVRLARQGKDATQFVSTLATFAARCQVLTAVMR